MVRFHVNVEPPRSWDFLELSCRSRGSPQVIELAYCPQHSCQCHPARLPTEASVRTDSVVDIHIEWAIESDSVRVREVFGLTVGVHKAAENFVARLHVHGAAIVVEGCRHRALAVRAECTVESDTFHGVVQEFLVRFCTWGFGPLIDGWEVLLPFFGQVVVQQLSELKQMIR